MSIWVFFVSTIYAISMLITVASSPFGGDMYHEAESLAIQIVEMGSKIYGPHNQTTMSAMNDWERLLLQGGQYTEAGAVAARSWTSSDERHVVGQMTMDGRPRTTI